MSKYSPALKSQVANRGVCPDSFLDELIAWGKTADDSIFEKNNNDDVYSYVYKELAPWNGIQHRKAVMLEVLRVLAGYESSWSHLEGKDKSVKYKQKPEEMEAGAFQVSQNSTYFGQDLKDLVKSRIGSLDPWQFQDLMKREHLTSIEYIARLLRRTVRANGPVVRSEINPYLRKDAVAEFERLLSS